MYGAEFAEKPWLIFNIWDSLSNDPSEGVAYSSAHTCPGLVNKRLCAFLPLTNCTMPQVITGANPGQRLIWPDGDFAYYTNASGAPLECRHAIRKQKHCDCVSV